MRKIAIHLLLLVCWCGTDLPDAVAQQPSGDAQQKFADLGVCRLADGQSIINCRLGYRTWGRLNAERSNAVLFPTWFAGTSENIATLVGVDKLVDPSKYFVIAVDALGNGVSSSPSNSALQPGPVFPAFTVQDMVSAEWRLVTEVLGLKHLYAVMGISMGGMQTFEWMVDFPNFMDIAIPIVGSPRLSSYDLLLWRAEEDALRSDPAWLNGHYLQRPAMGAVQAMHEMHLTTPAHYARTIPREKFGSSYAAFYTNGILPFDANDWLAQLEAMIHHDVARGGSLENAERHAKARTFVVVSLQDHMVNPEPAEDFAKAIGSKLFALESDCGHLSPGCEADTLYPHVRTFLDGQ